jgi:hypothetical protein
MDVHIINYMGIINKIKGEGKTYYGKDNRVVYNGKEYIIDLGYNIKCNLDELIKKDTATEDKFAEFLIDLGLPQDIEEIFIDKFNRVKYLKLKRADEIKVKKKKINDLYTLKVGSFRS